MPPSTTPSRPCMSHRHSFHIHMKNLFVWNKQGSKKLRTVSSSLHLHIPKLWLLLHSISRNSSSTHLAFYPHSHLWMHLTPPPSSLPPIRSSHPAIIYSLTPSSFSFSHDPFNLSWHHLPPPKVWRVDPVVALVGSRVVVTGGAYDFEDDPLAVEVLDVDIGEWTSCGSMSEQLKGSSSPHWLSVAAKNDRMYMTERSSGRTYTYRPNSSEWNGPHDLRVAPNVFQVALGCVDGGGMSVVGVIEEAEEVGGVKLWEVELSGQVGFSLLSSPLEEEKEGLIQNNGGMRW